MKKWIDRLDNIGREECLDAFDYGACAVAERIGYVGNHSQMLLVMEDKSVEYDIVMSLGGRFFNAIEEKDADSAREILEEINDPRYDEIFEDLKRDVLEKVSK